MSLQLDQAIEFENVKVLKDNPKQDRLSTKSFSAVYTDGGFLKVQTIDGFDSSIGFLTAFASWKLLTHIKMGSKPFMIDPFPPLGNPSQYVG